MIKLRHNVLFLLHRREQNDVYAHLVCRVTWTGARSGVTLNLGYTVEPDKWCAASQSCQARTTVGPQHVPARQINNEIAQYRTAYNKSVEKYKRYVRKYPQKIILEWIGYENQDYKRLEYDAPKDAPQDLFGEE